MRIVRYTPPDPYRGVSRQDLSTNQVGRPSARWGMVEGDRVLDLEAPPFDGLVHGRGRFPLSEVTLLPPVMPSKIVAVGLNYEGHIREMGKAPPAEPLLFLKAPSAVLRPGGDILLPPESSRVDYEGELGVVIGRRCRRVTAAQARSAVAGFTIVNDVTARDLQARDVQYSRAKSFDTFCPVGPWIETELDPGAVRITTVVNAQLRQDGDTATMRFGCYDLVAFASAVMTLEPGDLLATGTPAGVGPLADGDEVSVAIEGVGVLTNHVRRESR